jgi:hypothetical protein
VKEYCGRVVWESMFGTTSVEDSSEDKSLRGTRKDFMVSSFSGCTSFNTSMLTNKSSSAKGESWLLFAIYNSEENGKKKISDVFEFYIIS